MVPALVLAEQLVAGRPLHLRWSGALRSTSGPAPTASSARADRPGAQGRPERLVTCGGYAHSRNPVHLGHLVLLGGLTLLTRSPVAVAVTAVLTRRVRRAR